MKQVDRSKFQNIRVPLLGLFLLTFLLIAVEYFLSPQKRKQFFLQDKSISLDALVINEIMTANKGAYADEFGEIYDWIELYNGTDEDIDLTGFALSDEESGHTKWIFPTCTIKKKEYLIVYLAGQAKEGLYANFALDKAGSEIITLKNKNGKVMDSVRTIALNKNISMARDSKGNWSKTSEISPGYRNDEEGRTAYLDSLRTEDENLEISEFLPSNKGNILLEKEFYSYIELRNKGKEDVFLKDYFISNETSKPFRYRLPNKVLKPNEVYVIYTSEIGKDNHANFSLSKKNGVVILSKKNKIVELVTYENVVNGFAYVKDLNGIFHENTNISPGYPNEQIENYALEECKNPEDLIISEVMSSNQHYLVQNGGEYYDWIELYNNTNHSIDLSEYSLTLSEKEKKKYVLPKVELKSGGYYLLMASGNVNLTNSTYAHTNFKISSSESIYLYHGEELADSLFFSSIPIGYSYGRSNTKGFYYFSKPTPGVQNSVSNILEMPIEQ